MNRWKQLVVLAVAATTVGLASVPAQAGTPSIDRREARQRARIEQGIRSGKLNRMEARRLRRGHRHMHRLERRFGRDGTFSRRERMRMHRALDRESGRIFRLKHNARHRGGQC